MELDDLKKYLYVLAALIGLGWYVNKHYTFHDVVKLAKEKPHPEWSPRLTYYAGMGFYLKDDHDAAIETFTQLLTDYPTCQYADKGLLKLGTSLTERRRYQEAREVYEKYMEQFPNGPDRQLVDSKYEFIKFR